MKPARKKKYPEDEARRERKEQIKDIMKNGLPENYIHSIHQYCDRWCEKCDFTARCTHYVLEKKIHGDEEADINSSKFWEDMSLMFEATIEMLDEKMKELGISTEEPDEDPEKAETQERNKHPLSASAYKFSIKLHKWIQEHDEALEKVRGMKAVVRGAVKPSDALETILWYNLFISAKLERATSALKECEEGDDEFEAMDMNGSAKIALIAIDRSIGAWGALLTALPQFEDDIYGFIKTLIKYRKQTEKIFPDARAFVRPGFDE